MATMYTAAASPKKNAISQALAVPPKGSACRERYARTSSVMTPLMRLMAGALRDGRGHAFCTSRERRYATAASTGRDSRSNTTPRPFIARQLSGSKSVARS